MYWRSDVPDLAHFEQSLLPYAYGRSYGDSCLNEGGVSLDVSHLRRFISFDEEEGILCCEAGVSLAEVLELVVPRGWFIPVSPGTRFVSVGGAIANDIHGKNHHRAGTFGCHVTRFELLRSNGERFVCSPYENSEFFRATIGGLGLTGVILWAEFRLKPIVNPFIDMERIQFSSLDEFMQISAETDKQYEYSMSWVDILIGGQALCRGIFMCGNHNRSESRAAQPLPQLLGHVRRVRLDQGHGRLGCEARVRSRRVRGQLVHELHHGRDRGVEREPPSQVVGDLVDRPVGLADEREAVAGGIERLIGGARLA